MKMLLLSVEKQELIEVEASCYEDYYRLMDCDTVDVCQVLIAGVPYNIIADENACMVMNPRISAIDRDGNIMLVGSLLITGPDDMEGKFTELSEEDFSFLKKRCKKIPTIRFPEGSLILTSVTRD